MDSKKRKIKVGTGGIVNKMCATVVFESSGQMVDFPMEYNNKQTFVLSPVGRKWIGDHFSLRAEGVYFESVVRNEEAKENHESEG